MVDNVINRISNYRLKRGSLPICKNSWAAKGYAVNLMRKV